jgi:hypothetical protein
LVTLDLPPGGAEWWLALPAGDMLRCWSAGFLLGASAPLRLELAIEHEDGTTSPPVTMALPASDALAGIVELEPVPCRATRLRVRVTSQSARLERYDLFAISSG